MADEWRLVGRDSTSPAADSVPVDVSSADHTPETLYRALRVAEAGIVMADTLLGTNRPLNFVAGETRPVYVRKIYTAGTTATGIEGLL